MQFNASPSLSLDLPFPLSRCCEHPPNFNPLLNYSLIWYHSPRDKEQKLIFKTCLVAHNYNGAHKDGTNLCYGLNTGQRACPRVPSATHLCMWVTLVWTCAIPPYCTLAYELMSQAIPAPSTQHATINSRSFWNFGTETTLAPICSILYCIIDMHLTSTVPNDSNIRPYQCRPKLPKVKNLRFDCLPQMCRHA